MPANYILIERVELNTSAASITFANIPQSGYTDLKVVLSARTNGASHSWNYKITFNGASTNYSGKVLYGSGSAAASFNANTTYFDGIYASGSTATANTFGSAEMYIPNYTSSNNKSVSTDSAAETNATAAFMAFQAGLYSSSSAITSIKIEPEPAATAFEAYSTFSLYGLAAVGTTPAIAPKATGGNVIDTDGTYWIHTFNTSGTFTPLTSLTCDALVVAGGGGAGGDYGAGGGGAGGFRTSTGLSVTNQAYTVTIGAGGAGATTNSQLPSQGSNSVFSTITSAGGGRAGAIYGSDKNGAAGGSGGGGAGQGQGGTGGAGNTPSVSPSQGSNGGSTIGLEGGAGGGGASGVGGNNSGNTGGNGGAGTSNSYSGSAVTYAGGGAGSSYPSGGGTASGGGGTAGVSGTANRGGGGGGGNAGGAGGSGGSGIVIIRYPV